MTKKFFVGKELVIVELKRCNYTYQVTVNGQVYYETANKTFAICEFISI